MAEVSKKDIKSRYHKTWEEEAKSLPAVGLKEPEDT